MWFWHRLISDLWPPDRSYIAPNIVASVVQWAIVGFFAYLFWPRFRKAVDGWVKKHLHRYHQEHVAPGHDALHQKLDRLLAIVEPKEKEDMGFSATISGFVNEAEHDLSAVETAFLNDVHALVEKYDEFIGFARVTTAAGEADVKNAVVTTKDTLAAANSITAHDEAEADELRQLDAAGVKAPEPAETPAAADVPAPPTDVTVSQARSVPEVLGVEPEATTVAEPDTTA